MLIDLLMFLEKKVLVLFRLRYCYFLIVFFKMYSMYSVMVNSIVIYYGLLLQYVFVLFLNMCGFSFFWGGGGFEGY